MLKKITKWWKNRGMTPVEQSEAAQLEPQPESKPMDRRRAHRASAKRRAARRQLKQLHATRRARGQNQRTGR